MARKVLGVIPVRGGSKRVPDKNIRTVGGKPLVAHAISHAEKSTAIDRAVVSTDDPTIRDVAESYGGTVPFERPAELATDTATSDDVVLHALDWFEQRDEQFDIVSMVQATSPFRTPGDIDAAIERLQDTDGDSVISVSEFDIPPVWAVTENQDGQLHPYLDEGYLWTDDLPRSQDTPALYHPNGAVFAAYVDAFRKEESFYTEKTVGYKMPRSRSLDIDEPFDLDMAKAWAEYQE
ncbi:acylneuraminate cytidylyltransferase family protein [Halovenus sp. HT40]|uniref:acylneuraminate cytidylyltransferase family protein n=1 Tax=Halovenus sp. HT40 TaxID=3126691 RepID=UPI00300F00E0